MRETTPISPTEKRENAEPRYTAQDIADALQECGYPPYIHKRLLDRLSERFAHANPHADERERVAGFAAMVEAALPEALDYLPHEREARGCVERVLAAALAAVSLDQEREQDPKLDEVWREEAIKVVSDVLEGNDDLASDVVDAIC